MARSNRRIDFPLTTLNMTGVRQDVGGFSIVQIFPPPASISGVEVALEDGPAFFPLMPGVAFKLQVADGADKIDRLTLRGPPQNGSISMMFTDDPIPLLSAASGSGGQRFFDYLWLPHLPSPPGTVLIPQGLDKAGMEFPNFLAPSNVAPGVAPQMSFRSGRQCVQLFPRAGGRSGLRLYHTLPWVRARALGILTGAVCAKVQSYHFAAELARDAVGGVEGLGSGMYFIPADGTAANEIAPDAGGAFLGVVADGAGGWQFAARALVGGPVTLAEPLNSVWPSLLVPVRVELVLLDADTVSGRDGLVILYLNDAVVKTYSNMAPFPEAYGNGVVGDVAYRPVISQHGNDAQSISVAKVQLWTAAGLGVPNV